jgi:glycosyltransferase involved in cell wall biosynthesis
VAETVSVVIAVYNGERYLRECVESILAQSVPPAEIIVVDDGSTDGSATVAASFGPPVTVLTQQNAGQAAAICAGLARATGTCLAFNDADDLWTPHKQEWQLAALADNPDLDVVFGLTEQFVSPELDAEEQRRFSPRVAIMPGEVLQAALTRRRAFDRVGGINSELRGAGITDWIARMKTARLASTTLPEIVIRRRLHRANYGRTHVTERDGNLLGVLRRHIERSRSLPPGT